MRLKKIINSAILLMVVLLSSIDANATSFDDLFVDNPFPSDLALARFRANVPSVSPDMDPYLRSISSYRYSFSAPGDCPAAVYCDPRVSKYIVVHREISLRLPDIASTIRSALNQAEFDDCSWLKLPNLSLVSLSNSQLLFHAELHSTKRACIWTPLGTIKEDLVSASGDVYIPVNLTLQPPSLGGTPSTFDHGGFSIGPEPIQVRVGSSEILGFINGGTLVGQIITGFANVFAFSLDNASFNLIHLRESDLIQLLNKSAISLGGSYGDQRTAQAVASIPVFLQDIEGLGIIEALYAVDIGRTRFSRMSDGSISLQISYFSVVSESLESLYYSVKDREIRLLASLSKDSQKIEVSKGDTLWSIAIKYYGVGDYWRLLAESNRIESPKMEKIKFRDILVIPAFWEFYSLSDCLLRPGDTLWKRYIALHGSASGWNAKKVPLPFGSPDANHVYSLQCVHL